METRYTFHERFDQYDQLYNDNWLRDSKSSSILLSFRIDLIEAHFVSVHKKST